MKILSQQHQHHYHLHQHHKLKFSPKTMIILDVCIFFHHRRFNEENLSYSWLIIDDNEF